MLHFRNEVEMRRELALSAVRENDHFHYYGEVYTQPSEQGNITYKLGFLDIRFIETGKKDAVVAFHLPKEATPAFYCLLSELQDETQG